jgi:uncharacterized protein DUF3179
VMKPTRGGLLLGAALVIAGCGASLKTGRTEATRAAKPCTSSTVAHAIGSLASGWRTDFCRHAVPLQQFFSGGPGKDGIPAIDRPRFAAVREIRFLKAAEPVIELVAGGQVKAYPLQILIWHEIVNDEIDGVPVAVTFCPLCNTAIVFDRRLSGRTLDFATTGNLRDSDLVMYDRQTESWWQQFGGRGLVGRYAGATLRQLPARIISWHDFVREHPEGLVLTRATGYSRDYGQNPYVGYDSVSSPPFFPAAHGSDHRLQPKERVVLVERRGQAVAVPFSVLAKTHQVEITVGGTKLRVRVTGRATSALDGAVIADSRQLPTVEVVDRAGKAVPFDEPFWFAVAAFRPQVVLQR